MKQIRTFNIPMCWTGIRPYIQENSDEQKKQFEKAILEGFTVTHITSSTVNDVMYVYHILEKEVKE